MQIFLNDTSQRTGKIAGRTRVNQTAAVMQAVLNSPNQASHSKAKRGPIRYIYGPALFFCFFLIKTGFLPDLNMDFPLAKVPGAAIKP